MMSGLRRYGTRSVKRQELVHGIRRIEFRRSSGGSKRVVKRREL